MPRPDGPLKEPAMPNDLEREYNPRLAAPNFAESFARWQTASARTRAEADCYLDVAYGASAAERLDVFRAQGGASRALLLFIHGGYWRALDKSDHSFVAPAYTRAGVTVAVANYSLCPAVTVEDIVRQMLQATAWLYRNGSNFGAPAGEVYVAGHSAGGHLATMMLAALWPQFAPDLPARTVRAAFSVSGLYDVAPLVRVPSVQTDVRLTPESVRRLSPAYMPPATDAPLYSAVGELEPSGFHDQLALIRKRWSKVNPPGLVCRGKDHFSVLDHFATAGSDLHRAVLSMMGL